MAHRKFKLGQTVIFKPARMGFPVPNQECTIVRLLPTEGDDWLYRIKCPAEAFERVVRESQLEERG
jgi:hypothetical protein